MNRYVFAEPDRKSERFLPFRAIPDVKFTPKSKEPPGSTGVYALLRIRFTLE